ncbi:hypothetical protein BCR35DRAFT_299767 [Leucosporidium creatinivorum]|uniref:RING-type E3 ubiquitin transferase n=1 Tax=Leucosporidium creatinivorum TaxID=106004 RepID=A0A1Y2G4M5_9BASI|nr:hypothetical protein BCR35DRAFT_299767 [Leucosporidium creatinivorum]
MCGHLYCWPCIHEWFETCSARGRPTSCPDCKAASSSEQVVPIFSTGGSRKDPRSRPTPPRPAANAPPPPRTASGLGSGLTGGNFRVQAGIFPLPGLMMSWSSAGAGTPWMQNGDDEGVRMRNPHGGPFGDALGVDDDGRELVTRVFLVLFVAMFVAMAIL